MNSKLKMALLSLALCGCAQLQHGETQPVIYKSVKDNVMYTTCSGMVEGGGSCYEKAAKSCVKGFNILSSNENAVGAKRELTFQCKK